MMKIENVFFVLLITTIVLSETNAWLWGRRRRTPGSTASCTWKWGTCSQTCGRGYQSPVVTKKEGPRGSCKLPARRSCYNQCCRVDCQWGSWGPWNPCSATCHGGISERKRSYAISARCRGSPCIGESTRSRICNDVCCPVDCQWGRWTSWSTCSRTDEIGIRKRHRFVAVDNSCGGKTCQGKDEEIKHCW